MLLQALGGAPLPSTNPGLGLERTQGTGLRWRKHRKESHSWWLLAGSMSPPGCRALGIMQSGGIMQQFLQQCR